MVKIWGYAQVVPEYTFFPSMVHFPPKFSAPLVEKKIYVGLKKRFGGVKWYGHPL